MGAYVLLTVRLRQRGSAESKGLDGEEDRSTPIPRASPQRSRMRRGPSDAAGSGAGDLQELAEPGVLHARSRAAFLLHAHDGRERPSARSRLAHGQARPCRPGSTVHRAQFWFESLQNWQSEFLAVAAIVILTIFLRQQGSPESKPVHAPHHQDRQLTACPSQLPSCGGWPKTRRSSRSNPTIAPRSGQRRLSRRPPRAVACGSA